jgi:predicted dehydrogenase
LKILVIGYGSIGKRHIKNLLSIPNIEVIVLTKQKSHDSILKKCSVHHILKNCILEKPSVAIIANNSSDHIEIALKLAKEGIDLFIEKPLSNNLKNIRELSKTVKSKKLLTMIGCNLRFHPCIKKIKQIIDKKTIGKILSVQIESGSYLPDWHPNENYQKSYASRNDLGGGVILTCIHEIDYLYWFFGMPDSIVSQNGKYSDLKINVEDLSLSIIKFPKNFLAELHLDYFQRPDIRKCKIIGTKGTIMWNSKSNQVKLYNSRKNHWTIKLAVKNYSRNDMYVDEIKHFLNCIKQRKQTINPLHEGIETLRIALSIKKSSKTGRLTKI